MKFNCYGEGNSLNQNGFYNNDEEDIKNEFKVVLTYQEKVVCLKEILNKLKKILHVYEKSLEDTNYNYKVFCGGILIYISSSNDLFDGELVNLIINLNAVINNDFDKKQLKRIVFECRNQVEFLIDKYTPLIEEDKVLDEIHQQIHDSRVNLDEYIKANNLYSDKEKGE